MRFARPHLEAARDRSATSRVGSSAGLPGGALLTHPLGLQRRIAASSLACGRDAPRFGSTTCSGNGMITLCRKAHPGARGRHPPGRRGGRRPFPDISVDTTQVSVLTSPNTPGDGSVDDIRGAASVLIGVVAEVGPAPMPVHRTAAGAPNAWAHGADAVLIGAVADEFLRPRILENRKREWDLVFPGLPMPQGAPS